MKQRPFLALWTLATLATVVAFIVHLGLRGRTVDFGYKLGRARAEQGRLREVKRVLSLEAASFETPQRVEHVAQSLLGMSPPSPDRVIALRGYSPTAPDEDKADKADDLSAQAPAPSGSTTALPAPAADGGAP